MHSVSFEYSQSHLLELLKEVTGGESVEFACFDSSVVVMTARAAAAEITATQETPSTGEWPFMDRWKGKVVLHEGWNDPIPEEDWDVFKS